MSNSVFAQHQADDTSDGASSAVNSYSYAASLFGQRVIAFTNGKVVFSSLRPPAVQRKRPRTQYITLTSADVCRPSPTLTPFGV